MLEVGAGAELEHLAVAFGVALGDEVGYIAAALQAGDGVELGLERVEAILLDGRLVHARVIEPADLLLDRAGFGAVRVLAGFVDDVVLSLQARFVEHIEGAPAGLIVRDRIGSHPLGIDEAVEVLADVDLRVELADVEDALADVGCRRGAGGSRGGTGSAGTACRRVGSRLLLAAGSQRQAQAHGQCQRQGLQILLAHGYPSVSDVARRAVTVMLDGARCRVPPNRGHTCSR